MKWDRKNRSVTDDDDDSVSDSDAALVLANDHPKSRPPTPQDTQAELLNQGSAGQPKTGIGVGGALPIGAFQS